jgi:hypothetical protein
MSIGMTHLCLNDIFKNLALLLKASISIKF